MRKTSEELKEIRKQKRIAACQAAIEKYNRLDKPVYAYTTSCGDPWVPEKEVALPLYWEEEHKELKFYTDFLWGILNAINYEIPDCDSSTVVFRERGEGGKIEEIITE